jgi:DNA-binding NarL/FixJ family response regulator
MKSRSRRGEHREPGVKTSAATDLERGRTAHEARRWRESADRLAAADRAHPLGTEDLERLAWSYGLAGHNDLLLATLERLHDAHVQAGSLREAARAAFWLGFRLLGLSETGRGTAWIGSAHRLLDRAAEDCVERGYLLLPTGLERLGRKDAAGARDVARQASAIGERFEDPDLASLARTIEGQALIALGEYDAGLALLDEAILPATTGRLGPVATGIVYCAVIGSCRRIYAIDRAREWSAALADWCDAQPELVEFNGACRVHRAEILQLQGAWRQAMDEIARAATPPGLTARGEPAGACYQRGELLRLVGQYDTAEEAYRESSRLGLEPQPGLALLRLSQGQGDAAAAAIRRVIAAAGDPLTRARYLPAAVEILLATGDLAAADAAAADLEQIADATPNEILGAMAGHARGALLLAQGVASEAIGPLRAAFETWQRVGAPYIGARIRVLIANALDVLGDADGAELERDAARAVFQELEASPDLARVQSPAAPRAPGKPFGLTAREIEVLRLVASGRTNRAISQELFLSEKTVDRHVSNIFAKLDVPTRTAATTFAYRHNLI